MYNKLIMESNNAKWLALIIKKKAIKDKERKKLRRSFVSTNVKVKFKLTKGQRRQLRNSNPIIVNPPLDLARTQNTTRPQTSNYNIIKPQKRISTGDVSPIELPSTNSASLINFQRNSSQLKPLFGKRLFKADIMQKLMKGKEESPKNQMAHHLRNTTAIATSDIISKNQNWYSKRRMVRLVLKQLWKFVVALLSSDTRWISIHCAL
jgi:hypothetical protein